VNEVIQSTSEIIST